jgi:hypothetical protein
MPSTVTVIWVIARLLGEQITTADAPGGGPPEPPAGG